MQFGCFYDKVVEVRGLPFEIRKPTPETVAAMIEAREMTTARYGSAKELFDALDEKAGKRKARATTKENLTTPARLKGTGRSSITQVSRICNGSKPS